MSLSLSSRGPTLAALLAASCPCLAQDELSLTVDKLAYEAHRPHAIEELVRSGEACLPLLIDLLKRSGDADEPPAEQLVGALQVIERLGAAAKRAGDAVTSAFRYASDLGVRNAAMSAIGELTPGLSEATCANLLMVLRRDYTPTLDPDGFVVAQQRLILGPTPDDPHLHEFLEIGNLYAVAAARSAHDLPKLSKELRADLQEQLARALLRPALPWLRDPDHSTATGDIARALLHHGADAADVVRGLLFCREPQLRRLGLESLHDVARWTPAERFDLVRMLWDPDRATQELAVASISALDADGLIALRPLRAFEAWARSQGAFDRAGYYRRCADRLAASAASRGEVAAELVRCVDQVLRGESPTASPQRCDDAGRELLAAIVRGCGGVDDDTPLALARLAVTAGAIPLRDGDDPLRDAFLSLLDIGDEQCWFEAARALAELGPDAAPAPHDELGSLLLESRWRFSPRSWESLWTAEAAILAGPAADAVQLAGALASERWHVALRAAVELLGRGEVTAAHRDRLIAMLGAAPQQMPTNARPAVLALTGRYVPERSHTAQADAVRAVAAMALASIGDGSWRDEALRQVIAGEVGWPLAELERRLDDAREHGTLGELARQIELKAWNRTGWPRFP
ncbi:MAG: hypothetical protein H6835_03840 [Planctomycetes bacterium]|nr:hypothetical protein [Planctomycetota bacterium]